MHHGQSRGEAKNEKERKYGEFINCAETGGYATYIIGLGDGHPWSEVHYFKHPHIF